MAKRNRTAFGVAVGLALLFAVMPCLSRAAEGLQPIPVAELPAAVADTAAKLCPDAKITAAKKEMDLDGEGQLEEIDFELEVTTKSGKSHAIEIDTTPDGKVKLDECNIRGPVVADDLPATVADAAKKLCPEGKMTSGERRARFHGDQVQAEFALKLELAGGKAAEVRVDLAADGSLKQTRVTAPLAVEEVPKSISDVLALLCPGATVAEAEKQTEARGDKVRVEFELKLKTADGKECKADVRMGDDGRIRRIEVQDD